tara:strand:+ start:548 stop:2806 length:2259 start_codon:yes stop_codon:yes gene_type:complete
MQKRILCYAVACLLLASNLSATYIYEANQSLFDLTNQTGTTNLNVGDDQVSSAFNLGFTFDFYGSGFTQARMATNGCLHFKTSGAYCNDFTPDPLASQYTYTLLPFWTDLIRDNNSSMLAKSFSDKTVFGWYDMREYNRSGSDNSFEVILWTNDNFEFRYGGLDVINHDVLIGEIGSGSKEIYQYYYHDECNTGSTNGSSCYNYDWNNSDKNTNLENGGSLYGVGTGNATDCSNPLNDASCSGYAAAYQTQQCDIDQLYNDACPYYWDAYDDQQCDINPQYAPFCLGYSQQNSVAYFDEETDYGYQEEDLWYDEEYDEWLDPSDPCYENNCSDFTDADWYALDVDQFGQEQVDDWLGADVTFNETGMIEWDSSSVTSYDDIDAQMDIYDLQQEQMHQDEMLLEEFLFQETFLVEDYSEPETFIEFNSVEELEEWFEEETQQEEERMEEELAELDDPEEEFIEEIFEEEVVEEVFEAIEERMAEAEIEEERIEREEIAEESLDVIEEEFAAVEKESPTGKNKLMSIALNVVKNGVKTATNSFSTATGGSVNNNSSSYSSSSTNSTGSSSSSGGISTSNSPSASDQFASASAQTNQVLSMSSTAGVQTSSVTNAMSDDNVSVGGSTVVQNVAVASVEAEISVASSDINTTSEADQVADKIIAANIEVQQKEIEQEQEDTGRYGDESKLIALIGYVPAFNAYSQTSVPDAQDWYASQSIYSSATLNDNTGAFYGLVNSNLKGLSQMMSDQPNMWR